MSARPIVRAHVLLVLVTLVWGATFVEIKDALGQSSPLIFNAVRMTLASAVLAAIYFRSLRRMSRRCFFAGIVIGLFLALGYAFQTTGLAYTTPAKSAFLTGLSVVLVPVFLALFWRKRAGAWNVAGVIAAFMGLYLLTVPAAPGGRWGDLAGVNFGDLLTILCAIAFAFQIILVGRATILHSFENLAILQTATAAVVMSAAAPLVESVHIAFSLRVVAALLVTGLLGTAAAFTIQAWAQQFISATNTALIFALEPVFAWLTSYLLLGERLGWRAGAGALLILGGLLASEILGAHSERISPPSTQPGFSPPSTPSPPSS